MAKYHVNPTTGNPGVCKADPTKARARGCDFGQGESEHYDSADEARAAYEVASSGETFGGSVALTKKKPKDIRANKLTPINYDELEPDAKAAIADYQGWNFDRWNNALRRDLLDDETRRFQTQVAEVDRLIRDHKTDKPVVLYRSLKTNGGTARFIPPVGGILEDRAYMSFSQNADHQEFLEGNWYEEGAEEEDDTPCEYDLILEVETPEGSSALPLPSESRVELSEQEVLLPRDSQIKILERIEESDLEGNPRIRLRGVLI